VTVLAPAREEVVPAAAASRATRLLITTSVPTTLTTFLLPYARHFRERGWVVHAASNGATGCAACRDAFDEVFDLPWTRRPRDPVNVTVAPRRLQALVEAGGYDLVHTHDPIAAFVTRLALRRMRARGRPRVIYTAHGFHFHGEGGRVSNGVFRSMEWVAGRWTDYLIVINRDDEQAARRFGIVAPDRLRYMPGIGVDLATYARDRVAPDRPQLLRAELGVPSDAPLLTMIAEFNPGKRHRDAVAALALAKRRDVHLLLAGTGPLMEAVRAAAADAGVGARVHLLGFRGDVPDLLHASFASILPSEREGLPRCIMESLCLERPVISTRIRGVRELVDDETGVLAEVGDVAAMARAIDALADDPELRARMGRTGRERMQAFGFDRVVAMHEALYGEALVPR
jgi:glycosyltransferase involved in cell wall biosynthesis